MTIKLQSETIEDITNDIEVLDALSWFYDNDFNGTNGDEYKWEQAKNFENNQAYVLNLIDRDDLTARDKINLYFETWLDGDSTIRDYDYILHQVNENQYTLTLAIVYED